MKLSIEATDDWVDTGNGRARVWALVGDADFPVRLRLVVVGIDPLPGAEYLAKAIEEQGPGWPQGDINVEGLVARAKEMRAHGEGWPP